MAGEDKRTRMSEYMQIIIWNGREVIVPVPFDINAALQAEKEQLEQQLAQARALLEEVGEIEDPGEQDGDCDEICFFCAGGQDYAYQPPASHPYASGFKHTPDCAWVKIRAFLAEHPEN